jgi:hypothetical protein
LPGKVQERSLCSLAGPFEAQNKLKPGLYKLVAGVDLAGGFHGFGQAAADGAKDEGWDVALGSEREIGALRGKLDAAVEPEAGFAEEFGGKAHVFGAIDTPEPELFFVALEEIDRFFELLHGFIEIGSQEKDAQEPRVARVTDADAHTIFSGLIAFHGAAVIIADCGHSGWHGTHQSLRVLALGGHLLFLADSVRAPWEKTRPFGNGVGRNQGFLRHQIG